MTAPLNIAFFSWDLNYSGPITLNPTRVPKLLMRYNAMVIVFRLIESDITIISANGHI